MSWFTSEILTKNQRKEKVESMRELPFSDIYTKLTRNLYDKKGEKMHAVKKANRKQIIRWSKTNGRKAYESILFVQDAFAKTFVNSSSRIKVSEGAGITRSFCVRNKANSWHLGCVRIYFKIKRRGR